MWNLLKKNFSKILNSKLYEKCRSKIPQRYYLKSYSQEGEDILLERFFAGKKNGFYVDVGAHHPKRFSNTYNFYKKGWQGINIDAAPGSMRLFEIVRPRDINLELGISLNEEVLEYYQFEESALNGFSKELSLARNEADISKLVNVALVHTSPLSKILISYLAEGSKVDFLSVDVEGLDLEVLKSNDWDMFRPKLVLVEVLSSSLDVISSHPIAQYMATQQYALYAKCVNTTFFIDQKSSI